jgi:CRISPR-associated endonuclease/helicase Cas3
MRALGLPVFRQFFHDVHGVWPFPWQERLLDRVLDDPPPKKAPWPEAITLPTASGKTACLDVALFALAAQADVPPQQRGAPRRICFIVDRRVIVDEAFERARKLAKALREAKAKSVMEIAGRLRRISGDKGVNPLAAFELRGGLYRDHAWARTPTQPTIICSTVDQLGSRLLFRGYGLGELTRPIHAGLAANDTLVFLDEAHVAEPFLETARSLQRYRRHADSPLPLPFHFVILSATPPEDCHDRFPRTAGEMKPDLAHNVLGARLKAPKPATFRVAEKAIGNNFVEPLAKELAAQGEGLLGEGRQVVAILVNRVATARAVHGLLVRKHGPRAVLLHGRMRPVDRDGEVERAKREFALDTRSAEKRHLPAPVFVVATQCLEVGADMDFDALVTECASLDALRQRFGRLNRGGRKLLARGVIVMRGDQVEESDDDPVYGSALAATWEWLRKQARRGEVDFGVVAMSGVLGKLRPTALARLRVPASHAPAMLPSHVDCWVQTMPEPCPSPDVSLFLHGPQRGAPEVHICWRADLPAGNEAQAEDCWTDTLALCPPAAAECLAVPLWQMREWLRGGQPPLFSLADADSREPEIKTEAPARLRVQALCWRGQDESFFVRDTERLRPGDTLVLRTQDGIEEWLTTSAASPHTNTAALDAADRVQLAARARPLLRLHPALIATWPSCEAKEQLLALAIAPDLGERLSNDEANLREEFRVALASLAKDMTRSEQGWLRDTALALVSEFGDRQRFRRAVKQHPGGTGVILRAVRRYRLAVDEDEVFAEEGIASSAAAGAVPLVQHTEGVAALAAEFARRCGLSEALTADLALAAQLHDLGKADLRFQALLRGQSASAVSRDSTLLAKSDRVAATRAEREADRRRAGYPVGGRHELLSVRLAESAPPILGRASDSDLVLHLIASHHGHCRPFAPVVNDRAPVEVVVSAYGEAMRHSSATGLEHLDGGVADRFWRLVRRYGYWGLAFIETVLRLADQRQSEAEQNGHP